MLSPSEESLIRTFRNVLNIILSSVPVPGAACGCGAPTPDTSLRLARYFGFSPDYWLNLQSHYDLEVARRQSALRIETEVTPREAA